MRVYRYLKKKYGLQALSEQRLRISNILDLNDPFEFFAVEMAGPIFRQGMNAGKSGIAEKYGILCFSRDWKNPVQWAHYANGHKGVCLGFDIPSSFLEKVTYVEERIVHDGKPDEELVIKLLKTKYIHWVYEKEYRSFVPHKEPEVKIVNGEKKYIYYMDFSDELILKNVIVGAKSNISRDELDNALGTLNSKVKIFKARAGYKKFEMAIDKADSL